LVGAENDRPTATRRRSAAEIGQTELFPRMKIPLMPSMKALFSAHRRNIDALTAANKVAMEGARAAAWKNLDIMRQAMADLSEGIYVTMTPELPRRKTVKQAEVIKQAYQNATINMKVLGDTIQHSSTEAVKLLNTRFTEALEEVQSLVHPANSVS
jgi:phasin family protein